MNAKKKTLSQEIAEKMRQNIANREWKTGDKIPTEKELMAVYGVSRITIREAIRYLVSQGLLHSVQGSGTYVSEYTTNTVVSPMTNPLYLTPISKNFILDLYRVRMLEIQVAGVAAEKSTPEDVKTLKEINNRLKDCKSVEEHAEIEVAFHGQICKMAGNPLMNDICKSIFDAMRIVFPIVSEITGSASCIPIHERLIDTIEKHYVEEAKKVMEEHVRITIEQIEAVSERSELFDKYKVEKQYN